jgi:predicted amidohydrolase YtcJ
VAEKAAEAILTLAIKPPSREDYRRGAALISKQFASRGITSACEADGKPAILQGYQDARDAGELAGRFYTHIDFAEFEKMSDAGVHTGFGDEWVRVGAVKLFADGSISERTALLSEPYAGLGDYRGISRASRETLYEQARKAYLAGWQVGTHANGDVAIDTILGVYEQLQRESPRRDPRLRIEHCTLVTPQLVRRIRAAGVIPLPFAGYVYFHGEPGGADAVAALRGHAYRRAWPHLGREPANFGRGGDPLLDGERRLRFVRRGYQGHARARPARRPRRMGSRSAGDRPRELSQREGGTHHARRSLGV